MTELASHKNSPISSRVGFMQGRLSPTRNGRIQSFPWETWKEEFEIAPRISLGNIEWTIDSENFVSNPIINSSGIAEINRLKLFYDVEIPSVTCDYFMENPPWKSDADQLLEGLRSILIGMAAIGAKILVIPLVDNSSLGGSIKVSSIKHFFSQVFDLQRMNGLKIAFETDLSPHLFADFINEFDEDFFGVNYDMGNSASFGFNPAEEFEAIGERIVNVHVKDRLLGGETVPLGTGNADFPTVFRCLEKYKYEGNLIMQTARAKDGQHTEALSKYRNQVVRWMGEAK